MEIIIIIIIMTIIITYQKRLRQHADVTIKMAQANKKNIYIRLCNALNI